MASSLRQKRWEDFRRLSALADEAIKAGLADEKIVAEFGVSLATIQRRKLVFRNLSPDVISAQREDLKLSLAIFLYVFSGESCEKVGRRYQKSRGFVHGRVCKVYRMLRHPKWDAPGEVTSFREVEDDDKEYYLGRLERCRESNSIEPIVLQTGDVPEHKRPEWTVTLDAMLGTMSDGQLARELGSSTEYVMQRRLKLKIDSYTDRPRVVRGDM